MSMVPLLAWELRTVLGVVRVVDIAVTLYRGTPLIRNILPPRTTMGP